LAHLRHLKTKGRKDLTEKLYFIAFSLRIAQKSSSDSCRKANGTEMTKKQTEE